MGFEGQLAGFFANNLTLDQEDLAHLRIVEMGIERRNTPDAPGFDPAVVGRRDLDKIGCGSSLE